MSEIEIKEHLKIYVTREVYQKIRIFTSNFTSNEVGGWLCGEFKDDQILIDDLLIPEQEVSAGDVMITGKQTILMRKEYGKEKCQRIIGHWHSHHNMSAFWSNTDENNMTTIMEPRERFVFLVTSTNKDTPFRLRLDMKIPFLLSIDNMPLHVFDKDYEKILKKCQDEWEKKVTVKTVKPAKYPHAWGGKYSKKGKNCKDCGFTPKYCDCVKSEDIEDTPRIVFYNKGPRLLSVQMYNCNENEDQHVMDYLDEEKIDYDQRAFPTWTQITIPTTSNSEEKQLKKNLRKVFDDI